MAAVMMMMDTHRCGASSCSTQQQQTPRSVPRVKQQQQQQVWGELVLNPATPFISALSLLDEVAGLADQLIVLTSPSKCFNVAGLDVSYAVAPSDTLRRRFRRVGIDQAEVTAFGYAATLSAYGDAECEAWRQRLVKYLRHNRDCARPRRPHRAQPRPRNPIPAPPPRAVLLSAVRRLLAPSHIPPRVTSRHVSQPATCHRRARCSERDRRRALHHR